MKALILMTIMLASIAQAGLEVSRVVRGTQKPSDYVVTNVTLTGVVESSEWVSWLSTNKYVKASDTNGWTVSAHQAWITADQVPAYDNTQIVSIDSNHFVRITDTNLVLYEVSQTALLDSTRMKLTVSENLYADPNIWLESIMVNAGTYYMPMSPYEWEYYVYTMSTNSTDGISWSIDGLGASANDSWLTIGCAPPREYYSNGINFNPEYLFSDYPLSMDLSAAGFVGYSVGASMVLDRAYTYTPSTNVVATFAKRAELNEYCKTNHIGNLHVSGNVSAGTMTLGGSTISSWPTGGGTPSVWTNMTWGAAGTNSTYRMSWDVTNGTFKVEEIVP